MEDADGDVDMVLEEEGAKIEEKERIAKAELEKELRQYRIKVKISKILICLSKINLQGDENQWAHELETKKNVANISIGRERKLKEENGKRQKPNGKGPKGKKIKKH